MLGIAHKCTVNRLSLLLLLDEGQECHALLLVALLQAVAPDFHLLRRQLVEGQVEVLLEPRPEISLWRGRLLLADGTAAAAVRAQWDAVGHPAAEMPPAARPWDTPAALESLRARASALNVALDPVAWASVAWPSGAAGVWGSGSFDMVSSPS